MRTVLGPGIGWRFALDSHRLFPFPSVLGPAAILGGLSHSMVTLTCLQCLPDFQALKAGTFYLPRGSCSPEKLAPLFGVQFILLSCGWPSMFSESLQHADGRLSGEMGHLASDT